MLGRHLLEIARKDRSRIAFRRRNRAVAPTRHLPMHARPRGQRLKHKHLLTAVVASRGRVNIVALRTPRKRAARMARRKHQLQMKRRNPILPVTVLLQRLALRERNTAPTKKNAFKRAAKAAMPRAASEAARRAVRLRRPPGMARPQRHPRIIPEKRRMHMRRRQDRARKDIKVSRKKYKNRARTRICPHYTISTRRFQRRAGSCSVSAATLLLLARGTRTCCRWISQPALITFSGRATV